MRRIETREELEKKRKRNVKIISLVMLAIMLFGSVGYAFSFALGNSNNGNDQQPSSGSNELQLTYRISEVGDIELNSFRTLESYKGVPLYISANNSAVINEISSTIGLYSSRVQEACYGDCTKNLPEKNCTEGDNLVVWRDSEKGRVYQENNCMFIEGDLRSVDAFIYRTFGQI